MASSTEKESKKEEKKGIDVDAIKYKGPNPEGVPFYKPGPFPSIDVLAKGTPGR